ncbi:DUF1667 domain-containing protein [Fonticella tunisiensis]|uniref:CxxC motif-containing protein n=1 Tax=Fonticella tunisiensis TaxID=1096341 RepID=A0A4R7KQB8_9CLOT|nr:DUF1667 domain-containing protein [Fonticella tunisiensis]TDT61339.1 CxxC motif-containing protein [Fonticella tunisiensis]
MIKKELICIGCPLGCSLEVLVENGSVIKISGHSCKKGEDYAVKECTNPTRIITTTLEVINGAEAMVSVKTERDIPKDKIYECIRALKGVKVEAPVEAGQVIVENILNTGVNVIATKNVARKA